MFLLGFTRMGPSTGNHTPWDNKEKEMQRWIQRSHLWLAWIPILALVVIWISEFSHNYFCVCNFAYFLMSQSFLISNGIQGRQINARSLTRALWVWNEIFQYLVPHFCFSKPYLYAANIHSYVKSPEIVFRFNNLLALRI